MLRVHRADGRGSPRRVGLGWVLHRGPATVTGIFRTLGRLADRHWTVYEKFFYRAAWALDALSRALAVHVVAPMILESGAINPASGKPVVDLAIDDTTAARYGKHVAHAGWFKDASAAGQATKGTVIHWAHNWIVGAVTLRLPRWPLMRWVLPVVFCLYRKPADCNRRHPFATRQVLAARLWYHVCKEVPIRLVIVRDPAGREKDDFFFCTDATVPDAQIAQRAGDRWGVEEAILEAKQHLGFEDTRGWCSKTVNRQAPLAMILVTLVKAWYARCAAAEPGLAPESTPWHAKTRPSFADRLAALRRVLWQHRISPKSMFSARVQEILDTVAYALCEAA
ncbi:MAG: transposase [Planctomycetota bacterium]|nr:transposase [Planctomycetota bacterium]